MATETSLIFVFPKDAFNYLAVDSFDLLFFSSCVPSLLFSFFYVIILATSHPWTLHLSFSVLMLITLVVNIDGLLCARHCEKGGEMKCTEC